MSGAIEKRNMAERCLLLFRAELAECAGRYEDMVAEMRTIANMDCFLSWKERKMLRLAYMKVANSLRASLSTICRIEKEERNRTGSEDNPSPIKTYRKKIQDELNKVCGEVVEILDKYLIPKALTPETRAFYYGMKGDFYRYKAQFLSGELRIDCASKSADAYRIAIDIGNQLQAAQPVRLAVFLNYSVLLHGIMKDREKAISVARLALNEALEDLDHLFEEERRESTITIQVLRDNLIMWEREDLSKDLSY